MDKTEFETLRPGDAVEIIGFASSVEIVEAEIYRGKTVYEAISIAETYSR